MRREINFSTPLVTQYLDLFDKIENSTADEESDEMQELLDQADHLWLNLSLSEQDYIGRVVELRPKKQ